MRSVIQEAATIAQAVELGWIKSGKPKDFTIKIFEEPQKKFFGFITVRKAKIGIFVEDRPNQRGDHRPRKHVPTHRRRSGSYGLRPTRNEQQPRQQQQNQQQQHPSTENHDHHDHDDHDHGPKDE